MEYSTSLLYRLIFLSILCFTLPTVLPSAHAAAVLERRSTTSSLKWRNCSSDSPPGLQCAELQVPLDYSKPHGAQITLGMNRLQAEDSHHRTGSLIFNPGGPGGIASSVIELIADGVPAFTPGVRKHFDLIGLDPRGVGLSTPVQCDPKIWNERVSYFPSDKASFEKMVEHNKALGESCLQLTGPLLRHIDTTSAAKDLEAVRLALGDGKLNFLGLSYGTQLGAAYAELYPGNIRAMALDGNLDHSQSETSNLVTESTTYETEFTRFAAWCSQTPSCALHGRDILKLLDDLVKKADHTPIPAPDCLTSSQCRSDVTGEEIRFNMQPLLATKNPIPDEGIEGWLSLGSALSFAVAGNASALSTPLATSNTSSLFAGLAIECLDWSHRSTSISDVLYKKQLSQVVAPHTQGASQTWTIQTGCIGWPAPVQNREHYANVKNTAPVLLVNSKYDPETSYVWANGLLAQFENAVLVTRDGDGHTSYDLLGETADVVDAYLVKGVVPADNSVFQS